jgi:hypothetical protein
MKAFIIGNGVSIDVGGTPRNLIEEIFDLYGQNKDKGYTRDTCFPRFKVFVDELSSGYKENVACLKKDGVEINNEVFPATWIVEDIEYLLTIIDLNQVNPVKVKPTIPGSDVAPYELVSIKGFNNSEIKEFRKIIQTYLVLLLHPTKIKPANDSLKNLCDQLVADGDTVITFNYDLLLEQELWKLRKWTPLDGYQIGSLNEADTMLKDVVEEIRSKGAAGSKVSLLKLHGSLNWGKYPNGDLLVEVTDQETGECYFDGIKTKGPSTGKPYEGRHNLIGMPPSFLKVFPNKEFNELWRKTVSVIGKAEEIYIIGYRLPMADAIAHLLIGQIRRNCPVYVVKPDAGELVERISKNFGLENVTALNYQFSEWVSTGFPKS